MELTTTSTTPLRQGANQALEIRRGARRGLHARRRAQKASPSLSGHVLHSLFWQNLTPRGGGEPEGELAAALDEHFGGFDKFKRQMNEVASTIMGSGWGALIWEPLAGKLLTTQIYDHQSNLSQGGVPILVLDAWEHAYYLQYQNQKADYFEAIWKVWNWQDVADRFRAVRSLDVAISDAATVG
jgi:Fe-Mn family superoxide dismutase